MSSPAGTILDRLSTWARERPAHRAFTYLNEAGGEQTAVCYEELYAGANAIAQGLAADAGIRRGERVVLVLEPGVGFIQTFLGCLMAGVAAIPADSPRRGQTGERLASIIARARPSAVLTTGERLASLRTALEAHDLPVQPPWMTPDQLASAARPGVALSSPDRSDVAMIQFTSGSTGAPKGAVITHGNIMHNQELIARSFGHEDATVGVGWLPLFHDMGLIGNVLQPLYLGTHSILMSPAAFIKRPERWLQAISRYRATSSGGPNFAYDLCVDRISDADLRELDLRSWKVAFNGSEPVSARTLDRFAERFREAGFRREALFPCYGLAEATLLVAGSSPQAAPVVRSVDLEELQRGRIADPRGPGMRLVSSGILAQSDAVVVVDPEKRRPCPPDQIGEIWTRSASVAAGYWDDPEASAEVFDGRLEDGSGPYLRTGDLGFLDSEGHLFISGRLKDLIIVRGQNVYPHDLEEVGRTERPELGRAAAFEDPLEPGAIVLLQEISRSFLRQGDDGDRLQALASTVRTAAYRRLGVQVDTIVLLREGSILTTTSGKVRRAANAAAWASRQFKPVTVVSGEQVTSTRESAQAAPADDVLEATRQVLAAELCVRPDEVEAALPLVSRGVDSLRAAALSQRLAAAGVDCPMDLLLVAQHLHDIAVPGCRTTEAAPAPGSAGPLPLMDWQKPFWFAQRAEPDSAAGNVRFAVAIGKTLDAAQLHRAVRNLLDRHESLRIRVRQDENGAPLQEVGGFAPDACTVHDARGWAVHELDRRIRGLVNLPFDLERDPLFKVHGFHRNGETILLVLAHHVCVDFLSMGVLFQELVASLAGDGPPIAVRPTCSFRDVVARQLAHTAERAKENDVYWQTALGEECDRLALPGDVAAPPSKLASRIPFEVGSEDLASLRHACARHGVTLNALLLCAYRLLLYRYTGQADAVIGMPVSRREAQADDGAVGCLINPLPIRLAITADEKASAVLRRTSETMLAGIRHGDHPIHRIASVAGRSGRQAGDGLFQTMFAAYKLTEPQQASPLIFGLDQREVRVGGLGLRAVPFDELESPFDMALLVAEGGDRLTGCLEHRPSVYSPDFARQMTRHFVRLMKELASDAERPVRALEMFDADECAWFAAHERTDCHLGPTAACAHWLVEEQSKRTPEATAIEFGPTRLTYGELDASSADIAAALAAAGIRPDDRVGVRMAPSPEWITALLALWKLGAVAVPIDGAMPERRVVEMRRAAGVSLLLDDGTAGPITLDLGCEVLAWKQLRTGPRVAYTSERDNSDARRIAYVSFTSGSSGAPNGVIVTHGALCNFIAAQAHRIGTAALRRVLQLAPIGFDAAFSDAFMSLMTGGALCIAPPHVRLAGGDLADFIATQRISLITTTPSLLELLDPTRCRDVVAVISMGEACSRTVAERWERSGAAFFNGYGPTEGTIGATIGRFDASRRRGAGGVPIGRPLANYGTHVLDASLNRTPIGCVGELHLQGAGLALGYIGNPALTAERFIPDLLSGDGGRLYRTGDLVRWLRNGELEFVGRTERFVKLRGVRIEATEITSIMREHPAVQDCYIDLESGAPYGDRMIAYVASPGREVLDDIREDLRQRLPSYMMPSEFVHVPSIPLDARGKVDRNGLRALDRAQPKPASEPPRAEMEREIQAAWEEVLGTEVADLDANFFDVGGHSLLLSQLQTVLLRRTGQSIALQTFFEHPSIRSQARNLQRPSSESGWRRPSAKAPTSFEPIAVVGMACRFPEAPTLRAYWLNIASGRSCISTFTPEALAETGISPDPAFVGARGIVRDIEQFDAEFFRFSPREAELLDPQKRLLLEVSQEALDDAGYVPSEDPAAVHVGVFVGVGKSSYLANNLSHHREIVEALGRMKVGIANDQSFAATLVAYKLNLKGPCLNVDTACSTSLVAVHQACLSLRAGECRLALAGGASVDVPVVGGHRFEAGSIASPDGACRAFDARAAGTVKGMGAGVVALKRLHDAIADGDHIYAVVRGSAINNDGAEKIGFTAPSIEGESAAIDAALQAGGVLPETLGYIETHGTGTDLGDLIEVSALNRSLASAAPASIAIGSVKSSIGHLDTAAGIAGFIKAALVVSKGKIPPQAEFEMPSPRLPWADGPLYVPTAITDWPASVAPRRAGVSAFGIGGTNAHVILEEPPAVATAENAVEPQLIQLSAGSATSLAAARHALAEELVRRPEISLRDLAHTLRSGRRSLPYRATFVCATRGELLDQLQAADESQASCAAETPKLVLVFPGEDSAPSPELVAHLAAAAPPFAATLDECMAVLRSLGVPARDVLDGAASGGRGLPAFVIGYALWRLLADSGVRPGALLGIGVGEIVCACAAGGLALEEALEFVVARDDLVRRAAPGASLSVDASPEELQRLLPSKLHVARFDSASGCVVTGDVSLIDRQEDLFRAAGHSVQRLGLDRPLHSPLMGGARLELEKLARRVAWRDLDLPVISTVTGHSIRRPDAHYWSQQLTLPVRLGGSLAMTMTDRPSVVVEASLTRNLIASLRRAAAAADGFAITLAPSESARTVREHLLQSLGLLWKRGAIHRLSIDDGDARRIALPGVMFDRTRHWLDAPAARVTREAHAPVTPFEIGPAGTAPAATQADAGRTAQVVEELWRRLLGRSQVDGDDDFFKLGGDSLLAIRLADEIRLELGVELSPRDVFQHSTFRGLVASLAPPSPRLDLPPPTPVADPAPAPLPLSHQQMGLWIAHEVEDAAASLNLPLAIRLKGQVDVPRLERAIRGLLHRHSILLHNFREGDDGPQQSVSHTAEDFCIDVSDVRAEDLDYRVQAEAEAPFAVSSDLLVRGRLLTVGASQAVLVVTLHHLVADGRSLLLLLEEFVAHYRQQGSLLPEPTPYVQYLLAETAADAPAPPAAAETVDVIADLPKDGVLRTDAPDVGDWVILELDAEVTSQIREACRSQGVTLFAFLLGAFQALVRRLGNDDDVAVLAPIMDGRNPEDARTVGPFVNLATFRSRITLETPFERVVEAVQREVGDTLEGRRPPGPAQRSQGAQTRLAFALDYPLPAQIKLDERTTAEVVTIPRKSARYDATLWVDDRGGALSCALEYRTALYRRASAELFMHGFRNIIEAGLQDPARSIGDAELLDPAERRTVLVDWNDTACDPPAWHTVQAEIARQARANPDAPAIIFEGRTTSYGELHEQASRVAAALLERRLRPEETVGLCFERSPELIAAILGILYAGGSFAPFDPILPDARIARMLDTAGVRLVLVADAQAKRFAAFDVEAVCAAELRAAGDSHVLPVETSAGSCAYVLFTSGSTGEPKGVMVEHQALANRLDWMARAFGVTRDDRILHKASIGFDVSLWEIFLPLMCGAQLVLAGGEEHLDVEALRQTMVRSGVTMAHFVPSLLRVFLDQDDADVPTLRHLVCSGEALGASLCELATRKLPGAPVAIANLYGPTEAAIDVSAWPVPKDGRITAATAPIGRPISNLRLYVLDARLTPLPVGAPGEIYIGGIGLARGYVAAPHLTAAAFVPDPFGHGTRLYRTGDFGRWLPSGDIEFLGRRDSQVKIAGVRIEAAEIERALLRTGLVGDAWVSLRSGAGSPQLVAHVTPPRGRYASVDAALAPLHDSGAVAAAADEVRALKADLLDALSRELPGAMIPSRITVVAQLPTTGNGKRNTGALSENDPWSRIEPPSGNSMDPLAAAIADLWREVLGGPAPDLATNFFERGGNSLAAIRLVTAIRRRLQRQVNLRLLFDNPTLGAMAAAAGPVVAQPDTPATISPEGWTEPFPMTVLQQAYAFGRNPAFQLGNVATHGYVEVRAQGLDQAAFVCALNALVRHHGMLRAVRADQTALQILPETPAYEPQFMDRRASSPEQEAASLTRTRDEMSHTIFPLDRWPLFEVRVTQLSDTEHVVHFSIDSLVVDGASVLILIRDLNALYRHALGGVALEPLRVGFRDFAVSLAGSEQERLRREAKAYWLRRTSTLPRAPTLPRLRNLNEIASPRFVRRAAFIPADAWSALTARARTFSLTPAAVVLAAYAEVLHRWSGDQHFLLNLPVFARPDWHEDLAGVVGNFTATMLLEVDLRGAENFVDAARRLHQQLWSDLAHTQFDGVELSRSLSRNGRERREAVTPFVFTGLFGFDAPGGDAGPFRLDQDALGVSQTSQVLLDCIAIEQGEGLILNWDAVEEAFPTDMLDEMFCCLRDRFEELARDEAAWGTTLRSRPPAWRPQNVRPLQASDERTLLADAAAVLRRRLDAAAVVCSGRSLSYRQLFARAVRLAEHLASLGCGREDPVAVQADKGPGQLVALLGTVLAGAAYVPIEPALPQERRRQLLEDSLAKLLIVDKDDASAPPGRHTVIVLDDVAAGLGDEALCRRVEELTAAIRPSDLAYIIYTSGTTGRPKGVAIEHAAAANTVFDINGRFGVGQDDAVLGLSSFAFDLSVYDLFGMLAVGGKIVLPEPALALDPAHWERLIADHAVTIWNSAPALMSHHLAREGDPSNSVRLVLLSGDWIPMALPAQVRARMPSAALVSLGGATEASIWSNYHLITELDPTWTSIPYGRPLSGQDLLILDGNLDHCPTWVNGHLYIAGKGLARGYLNAPEATAGAFLHHPRWGDRIYRTGDLGRYLADGEIEFLGRSDTQVKIRGLRLELGEIESLLHSHPGVREAAVLAEKVGVETRRLVAYVVPSARAVETGAARLLPSTAAAEPWTRALAAARAAAMAHAADAAKDALNEILELLEIQYLNTLRALLIELGDLVTPGSELDEATLQIEAGFAPRYARWVSRALAYLEGRRALRRVGERYIVASDLSTLGDTSVHTPEMPLAEILREDMHSAELYARDETAAKYAEYYRPSHLVLTQFLAGFVASADRGKGFRILEIGAGYGSLSDCLLPVLDGELEYVFTDISQFFLTRARDRYRDHEFVRYAHYDLDLDPQLQGFPRHSVDVVVLASVLHNARDIRQAAANLRAVLKPGGVVIFIEETRWFPFFDLGMGLQQGFDDFQDDVRDNCPLVSREGWRNILTEAGFTDIEVLTADTPCGDVLGFDAIAARAPRQATILDTDALTTFLEAKAPAAAIPSAWVQLEAMPLSSNGKVARNALRLPSVEGPARQREYVAPRTDTETKLQGIWARALGAAEVGVRDDFFELGGDSLVASRMLSELRQTWGSEMPLRVLFEMPTIEALAALIDIGFSSPSQLHPEPAEGWV